MTTAASITTAQSISDVPACAETAALSSISSTGCQLTDFKCICTDQSFISSLLPVVQNSCSAADFQKTITFTQNLCSSVGITLNIASITAAATAPSMSSAGPSSSITFASSNATATQATNSTLSVSSTAPTSTKASTTATEAPSSGATTNGLSLTGIILGVLVTLNVGSLDRTHETSLARYHVKDLKSFGDSLIDAVTAAIPNADRSPYTGVHVLLLRWEDDKLRVIEEVLEIQDVFRPYYRYEAEERKMPSNRSYTSLNVRLLEILDNHDGNNNPALVYCGGHAGMNDNR
ncbi:hypothetical protein MMC12_001113 [Toensbergia leucococca]|nr:hypothetical protein [Toensbergia leucococca]